jgi:hypothetical protein
MQYASRLEVKYELQKIRYQREVELPDNLLTLDDIGKHLKEGEKFHFTHTEHYADDEVNLVIVGYRDETEKERDIRVNKAEKYNENYEKFHAKYAR